MLRATNPYIPKIMFLRDVVIPFVKEREKEGKVNLQKVIHSCGSPSCLLGWSETFTEMGLSLVHNDNWSAFGRMIFVGDPDQVLSTLGISKQEAKNLFGGIDYGSLDDRAKACDRIIERMLFEVTV